MSWLMQENAYGDDKVFDACGLIGFIDTDGKPHGGDGIVAGLVAMKERGNGLGAGYAVYGLYPEFESHYAFHVMCKSENARQKLDVYLRSHFAVVHDEPIPTRFVQDILDPPVVWRYFMLPHRAELGGREEEDYIVHQVMLIHSTIPDVFVVSCGKNMGVFKGVGHPEQIAEFYRIEDYCGYMWTSHNRFPTNTPGWWGGAHPFGLLDWTVVHNGEISSYGINRRYTEMYGYRCDMRTDTEVITYAADLLMRRHKLPMELAARVFAAPLWQEIEHVSDDDKKLYTALRQTYGPLLLNGPFTIIVARNGEMMGLSDRVRLRPMVAASSGSILYVSSELAAIHVINPNLDNVWIPEGGEPVIGRLGIAPAPSKPLSLQRKPAQKELAHV